MVLGVTLRPLYNSNLAKVTIVKLSQMLNYVTSSAVSVIPKTSVDTI